VTTLTAIEPRLQTLEPPSREPSECAVRVAELTKRFTSRGSMVDLIRGRRGSVSTAVDRVTFDVKVGEIFGVLGPNGAGKTTIFKMLSTTVLPDDGTATICGHDLWLDSASVRRDLASVSSDERSLNWRLSARENLLLFAALHRVPRDQVNERIASTLEIVGLESTGTKMVAAFSSGMRQRLLIARALLSRPRVLLLDEPTRALDPISAQEFRAFLRRELIERQQCTIVLATHNADEALGFCDRVLVLNRGRVLATGHASELAARFGEERYRIVTTDPDHPAFTRLENAELLHRASMPTRANGPWFSVECAIPGDPSSTAHVLRLLLESGVPVARLERSELSLAELISRIITRSTVGESHA
jgi:ABC-2 type transport system ATP-binding protein